MTDKKQAWQVCLLWERTADMAARKQLTSERARDVITRGVADIAASAGIDVESMSIKSFLESWLKAKELETEPRTYSRYKGVVEQFLAFLGPRKDRDVALLTSKEILAFRSQLMERVTKGTTNIALKVLRAALNQARLNSLVDVNQAERVPLLKGHRSFERRPFTLAELKSVLAVANEEWRGMILVGLYTGLRLGDVALLTWANVDLTTRELRLKTHKTRRQQVLPIATPLLRHLESLPAGDDVTAPLFPNSYATKCRNPEGGPLSNQFHAILVAAGLAERRDYSESTKGRSHKREHSGLSFHCLRHTATSLLKNAGVSDAVARDLIGHDSAAVNAHYTHIEPATKRRAVEMMPDVQA